MSKNDLISDTFTIIRNGIMAKKESVDVPASNMIRAILEVLKSENYIETFKPVEDSKQASLRVYLRYLFGKPAIKNIKRVFWERKNNYFLLFFFTGFLELFG